MKAVLDRRRFGDDMKAALGRIGAPLPLRFSCFEQFFKSGGMRCRDLPAGCRCRRPARHAVAGRAAGAV
jgi:hypothetical protein